MATPIATFKVKNLFSRAKVLNLKDNVAIGDRLDKIGRLQKLIEKTTLLEPHVGEFHITGKSIKGWILVEPDGVSDDGAVKGWVQWAVKFVGKLPAK